ncbi:hypothetical protein C922_05711 [Plasmodium inui San Antonio 1]|uniref:Pv-fam-d protein n=1 Tax=Plasmodium inui San Antonio 1 TaxID=1237626 RepID=W6ZSL3_9APIC|nr:hypothetical protein C922_05711 [Plasmodium inui San Antonio 1]EUD63907.1 hypothetical protein C922_05711 [Plasmodium inui San Antonio 1]
MQAGKNSDHEGFDDEDDNDEDDDNEDDDDEDDDNEDDDDEDDDNEDDDDEDDDNPDEEDNCYQRRSYYPSGTRANENRDESEEIFTKTTRKRVKGNLKDTITQPSDTDSDEEGMCLRPSAKKSQGQQNYRNRRRSRVPQGRKSSGETGSDFDETSESSNLIDNLFEDIDKRIKKQPLRSLLPHTKGDNKSSKKEESSCDRLGIATSILKFFTPLLGMLLYGKVVMAVGSPMDFQFFLVSSTVLIIYLGRKLHRIKKSIKNKYRNEDRNRKRGHARRPLQNGAEGRRSIIRDGVLVMQTRQNDGIPRMRPIQGRQGY